MFQLGISQSAIEHGVLEHVGDVLERRGPGIAEAIRHAPYLTSFPASLDPSPWRDTRRYRQPLPPGGELPDWWPRDRRPLIYVTFGSVLGHLHEAGAVYRTALDAVGELPARVLMTTGRANDPSALGPIPPNTHVERWVPQSDVLSHARLVVCHGGSGTVLAALAAGLPLVVCPLFADQSANGRLVEQAGAGVVLEARGRAAGALRGLGESDVDPLRGAIERVLLEPGHREGAETVAAEIAATPPLEDVLAQLLAARCPSRRARSS